MDQTIYKKDGSVLKPIPAEHLIEAIGHMAEAIAELNEHELSIPKETRKTVVCVHGIENIEKLLDDAHTLAATSLAGIMYYNKHHPDHE